MGKETPTSTSTSTSTTESLPISSVHLTVICHGLWGEPQHTRFLAKTLVKKWNGKLSPSSAINQTETEKDLKKKKKNQKKKETNLEENDEDLNFKKEEEEFLEAQDVDFGLGGEDDVDGGSGIGKGKEEGKVRLVVLNTSSNSGVNTYDGIDWCGERVVKEIKAEIKRLAEEENSYVSRFSIVGYSLGGLIARFAIALLHVQGFFDKPALSPPSISNENSNIILDPPKPISFTTFATPHIGIPPSSTFFGKIAFWIGGRMLSRTGEQLYLRDSGWEVSNSKSNSNSSSDASSSNSSCLLSTMSNPNSTFYESLENFSKIEIYVNGLKDVTVPFRTGGIFAFDPFIDESKLKHKEIQVEVDPKYPALLSSYKLFKPSEKIKLTVWEKIKDKLNPDNLPWFINPSRLPLNFPLNYFVVLFLPLLFPVVVVLILVRFRNHGIESRKRLKKLHNDWELEDVDVEIESDSKSIGKEKENLRISRMLKRIQKIVEISGEEKVEAENPIPSVIIGNSSSSASHHDHHHSNGNGNGIKHKGQNGNENVIKNGNGSSHSININVDDEEQEQEQEILRNNLKTTQHPLKDIQLEMCDNLNKIKNVRKHITWFERVINSHAIIIVRTPSMEMHQKGIPVVQHFADNFTV